MISKFLSLVLVLTFLLAACAPAAPAAQPTMVSEPAPAAADFPTGKFIQPGKPDSGYIFNKDGTWSRFDDSVTVARGTYKVNGSTYTETSNDSCDANISFTYRFDGKGLTFNYVGKPEDDKCINRSWDMNNVTYTLANELPAETARPAAAFPLGRYSAEHEAVQYNPDGTFEFYTDASKIEPVIVGTYALNGDSITITANDTDPNCQGAFTYQWAFVDDALTFSSPTEDPCRGRREANADTYTYDPVYLPEIEISAADFSYISPLKAPSGWARVVLKNTGSEPHHVQFLRLNDGVTFDQFKEALGKGEGPALAMTRQIGGVGATAPGTSAQAVLDLPAGNYVILCLIPSPSDHVAHEEKGMISAMTVLDRSGHGIEPAAGLTVHLKDFEFGMPDTLASGPLTVQVVNDGPEPHEFNILQLADGKTVNDVVQFLGGAGGPPPFTPIGGMNGLDVGATGYAELDLKPGNYVAICNIPSPKAEGHPHFTLGMIKAFTVAP